jgi:hypothetical protein
MSYKIETKKIDCLLGNTFIFLTWLKKQFYRQWSIEEEEDAVENYDDDHYEEFSDLLFNQLSINIRKIPFEHIIENNLVYNNDV